MKSLIWEGIGMKNLFPHISNWEHLSSGFSDWQHLSSGFSHWQHLSSASLLSTSDCRYQLTSMTNMHSVRPSPPQPHLSLCYTSSQTCRIQIQMLLSSHWISPKRSTLSDTPPWMEEYTVCGDWRSGQRRFAAAEHVGNPSTALWQSRTV